MAGVDKPYSREDYAGALAANAAAKPFNLALGVGTIGAAMLVNAPLVVALLVGLLIYAIAAARTFFDEDEATAVLARERGEHKQALASGRTRMDPAKLAPDIRRHLLAARAREERIRDAIERAELPYTEVSTEVDALVTLMEQSARRAQLLYEALAESPPNVVRQRLVQLEGSGKTELIDALRHQHSVQRKMESQLERFYDEMERMVVELDTIRGSLVSVSASTDAGNQQRIAGDVRSLRDELDALASGMSEAFGEASEPA
jgi:Tfp pilus assembly protein PilO